MESLVQFLTPSTWIQDQNWNLYPYFLEHMQQLIVTVNKMFSSLSIIF